ncbi:MAG: tripartite tricarboxylate transporter substrate binding protein [Aquisalimonadaceae bacterium]
MIIDWVRTRMGRFVFLLTGSLFVFMPISGVALSAGLGDYPDRPITLIVPYPPGGSADFMARLTAAAFTERTGHRMVVDNRGGAGGNIAAEYVAREKPDGYTLIMGNAPILAINPHLYSSIQFDPMEDFQPVTPIAEIPLFLIAHPDAPFDSVQELVAAAKKDPGLLDYASGSSGSTTHLGMELFKSMAGVDLMHVPYRGSGPALAGISAGDVPVMFELMPSALPIIESGRVKVLAATTLERSPAYPDIPTVHESGVPDFKMASWFGVLAPAGTPEAIVEYLHAEIRGASQSEEFKTRLEGVGALAMSGGPAEFSSLIESELVRWGEVVEISGAKAE